MAIPKNYFDLVLVGRGYSISTYLTMADFSWCKRIAIVGGTDSWSETIRGTGVINHSRNLLAREITERNELTDSNIKPPSRKELLDTNKDIIKAFKDNPPDGCTVTYKPAITTGITRELIELGPDEKIEKPSAESPVFIRESGDTVPFYKLELKVINGDDVGALTSTATSNITALKVVYGGGAGPQTPPLLKEAEWEEIGVHDPLQGDIIKYPTNPVVMDLDTFMVRARQDSEPPLEKGNVALIGGNAGIDAAIEALGNNNLKLFWLIRGKRGVQPAWLPSKHYTFTRDDKEYKDDEAIKFAEDHIINYASVDVGKSENAEAPIRLVFTNPVYFSDSPKIALEDGKSIDIKYYVFAIGQSPQLEERRGTDIEEQIIRIGPAKVLDAITKDEPLTPVYDRNQRYGRWFETAVGLQDKYASHYQGLQVVGASALALAGMRASPVEQNYIDSEQIGQKIDVMRSASKTGKTAGEFTRAVAEFDSVDREFLRLSDYFNDTIKVPSVVDSMLNLVFKLNQRTVGAGDQLGTVRSQVAALTGYDLIAANLMKIALRAPVQKFIDTLMAKKDKLSNDGEKQAAYGAILGEAGRLKEALLLFKEDALAPELAINVDEEITKLEQAIDSTYSSEAASTLAEAIPDLLSRMYYLLAAFQAKDADRGVDFNGMDRTELAVYLAARYPKIKTEDWKGIIDKIVLGRAHRPTGYDAADVQDIMKQLDLINGDPRKAGNFTAP